MCNADRIHPEWQRREIGETIPLHWSGGLKCTVFEPNRAIGIEGWGSFVLEPIDEHRTRLLARSRCPKGWLEAYSLLLMEIPQFIMERRMLHGIKERAERAAGDPSLLDVVLPQYEFQGSVSTHIRAGREQIFRALQEVTLADLPLAVKLGTIRHLPGLLTSRLKRQPDEASCSFLDPLGSLVLAEEPDREMVIGGIGKLHNLLDQQFVQLADPAAFARFDEPGYEKLVESIRISGGDETSGYTIVGQHRTHAIGPDAHRKFGLYWYLMVGWAGNIAFKLLLEAVKRRAEGLARGAADERPAPIADGPIVD